MCALIAVCVVAALSGGEGIAVVRMAVDPVQLIASVTSRPSGNSVTYRYQYRGRRFEGSWYESGVTKRIVRGSVPITLSRSDPTVSCACDPRMLLMSSAPLLGASVIVGGIVLMWPLLFILPALDLLWWNPLGVKRMIRSSPTFPNP
jgi:hypothetical protein